MSRYKLVYWSPDMVIQDWSTQRPFAILKSHPTYQEWEAGGNTPDPADPPPAEDPQIALDRTDRDTFLAQVDGAITAVNNNGWDGLTAAQRKAIMLGILRALRVAARRLT